MLSDYFAQASTWKRHRVGLVGAHLDSFCAFLEERRYSPTSVRRYVRASMHLGSWAATHQLSLADFSERTLESFKRHLHQCRCREAHHNRQADRSPTVLRSARSFLRYLRHEKIAAPGPVTREPPRAPLLSEYSAWMVRHRGMQESTLVGYRRYLALLLVDVGDEAERLTAQALRAFILRESERGGPQRTQNILKSTRSFVRYLIAQGRCPAGLDGALPRVAHWKLQSLPQYLSGGDIQRLIDSCDVSRPKQLRDRAMLLLQAHLALRGQDVRLLRLDDINWQEATLRVRGGKGKHHVLLPLPQEAGEAVAAYIDKGRPEVDSPLVFLSINAPIRPLSRSAFGNVVDEAVRRSGVVAPSRGSHLLRHSAASEMLRRGATLQGIGAVLRHEHMDTTLTYAKVNVTALGAVAQPWAPLPPGARLPRPPRERRVKPPC